MKATNVDLARSNRTAANARLEMRSPELRGCFDAVQQAIERAYDQAVALRAELGTTDLYEP